MNFSAACHEPSCDSLTLINFFLFRIREIENSATSQTEITLAWRFADKQIALALYVFASYSEKPRVATTTHADKDAHTTTIFYLLFFA